MPTIDDKVRDRLHEDCCEAIRALLTATSWDEKIILTIGRSKPIKNYREKWVSVVIATKELGPIRSSRVSVNEGDDWVMSIKQAIDKCRR